MNFLPILAEVIPFFLMIGLGCITRVGGILNSDSEKSVLNLVLCVLYPCFVLWKVPSNESLSVSVVALSIGVGFSLTAIAFLVAWLTGRFAKVSQQNARGTFAVSAGLQNYGFIPIPLVIALFGDEALGVLFVHNLGVEIAMWTVGLMILSGNAKGSWKRLINGPTIAITIALFLNFTGLHTWVPGVANKAIAQLGNCTIPVSLILVGSTLAGVVQSEKWETKWNVIWGAMGVRFAIMPLIFLGAAVAVSFSPNLQRVLIVEAAMPAAVFPVVLAKHFGGKPGVATQIVIATSLASLILTPTILSLALMLFGIEI